MSGRALSLITLLLVAGLALPGGAGADPLDDALLRVDGAAAGDRAGARVTGAGDVNGDGRPDVVIAAPGVDTAAGEDAGAAYVVFGQPAPTTIDLGALGARGFRIAHETPVAGDAPVAIGVDAAGAGDFNGDGFDDVVVGVRDSADSAFVVFGKTSTAPVDLSALGSAGVRIRNAGLARVTLGNGDFPVGGWQVDRAGDVNGDGLGDIVLGAPAFPHPDHATTGETGAAFVVFGRRGTADVDARALGARGFEVTGGNGFCCEYQPFGASVGGVGDVNGDGRDDVAVGTPDVLYAGIPGEYGSVSRITVVLGKATTTPVRVEAAGSGVLTIVHGTGDDACHCGHFSGDGFAEHLDGVGDLNGDGRDDVAIGAPAYDDPHGIGSTGAAWVVYGRGASGVPVDVLERPGRLWLGGARGDVMGGAFAGDLDLDGDGAARDVAVLGTQVPRFPSGDRMRVFIQHGPIPTAPQTIERSELTGGAGAVLDVGPPGYEADLDGIRDSDGDGRDELVLGRAEDRDGAGSVHVFQEPPLACTITGTARAEVLDGTPADDVICAGAGNDTVDGRGGADTVYGQRGNDRLIGGAAADTLFGDLGDDRLTGGDADDHLTGGPGADRLDGGAGDDAGRGGSGRDTLLGGTDDDDLVGEDGGGTLNGDGGDDLLRTSVPVPDVFWDRYAGNQTMLGGDGKDVLVAGEGRDLLNGGLGDDELAGSAGGDRLFGTSGDDALDGGRGPDRLSGGAGADTLTDGPEYLPPQFDEEVVDTFSCGTAFDRALGTPADRIAGDCEEVVLE